MLADPLPCLVLPNLAQQIRMMTAAIVTGAKQTGKSTPVHELAPGARRYLSLDDLDVQDLARRDPDALLEGDWHITLDEVQCEPDLLNDFKHSIDRRRERGKFLLTGSASLLLMRQVSESLAGRASYLTLWHRTRREQFGQAAWGLWDSLLTAPESDWIELIAERPDHSEAWGTLPQQLYWGRHGRGDAPGAGD